MYKCIFSSHFHGLNSRANYNVCNYEKDKCEWKPAPEDSTVILSILLAGLWQLLSREWYSCCVRVYRYKPFELQVCYSDRRMNKNWNVRSAPISLQRLRCILSVIFRYIPTRTNQIWQEYVMNERVIDCNIDSFEKNCLARNIEPVLFASHLAVDSI